MGTAGGSEEDIGEGAHQPRKDEQVSFLIAHLKRVLQKMTRDGNENKELKIGRKKQMVLRNEQENGSKSVTPSIG
jgi:hypothetical protein